MHNFSEINENNAIKIIFPTIILATKTRKYLHIQAAVQRATNQLPEYILLKL